MEYVILACVIISVILSSASLFFAFKASKKSADLSGLKKDFSEESRASRKEIGDSVRDSINTFGQLMNETQKQNSESLHSSQVNLQNTVSDMMAKVDKRLESFSIQNEQKLDNIRSSMQKSLASIQEDNNEKLEKMRMTVDEKLQKTLDDKLSQSFSAVSQRLEQVYKGLGEMQNIAVGVGDLKKVLSNVKTRGILGEIQLGAILEQILSPEQYEENIATVPHSSDRVEFAIKLPADDGKSIYLPIDAKFPADTYSRLVDSYDIGDSAAVDAAAKELTNVIKKFAKDIHDKYVEPPYTTDFAIMFLPFEGLYAEVVRRGLVEILQRDYKICIAGPTTMAALLNSLQMGFKTLAIQKRSGEVWEVLGAVKTEFNKFGDVLASAQQRMQQANNELDKLVGVRTRQIQRTLKSVSELTSEKSSAIIGTNAAEIDE